MACERNIEDNSHRNIRWKEQKHHYPNHFVLASGCNNHVISQMRAERQAQKRAEPAAGQKAKEGGCSHSRDGGTPEEGCCQDEGVASPSTSSKDLF
jgi:hypothetical protein